MAYRVVGGLLPKSVDIGELNDLAPFPARSRRYEDAYFSGISSLSRRLRRCSLAIVSFISDAVVRGLIGHMRQSDSGEVLDLLARSYYQGRYAEVELFYKLVLAVARGAPCRAAGCARGRSLVSGFRLPPMGIGGKTASPIDGGHARRWRESI